MTQLRAPAVASGLRKAAGELLLSSLYQSFLSDLEIASLVLTTGVESSLPPEGLSVYGFGNFNSSLLYFESLDSL